MERSLAMCPDVDLLLYIEACSFDETMMKVGVKYSGLVIKDDGALEAKVVVAHGESKKLPFAYEVRGASDVEVSGNHWERCRVGLFCWDAGTVHRHGNIVVDLLQPENAELVGP